MLANIIDTGNYDGQEVIQLYVKDLVGSVTRPVRELKGFQKINLEKGKKQTLTFGISFDDLKFHNLKMQNIAETREFEIFVGGNSNADLKAKFELVN